MVVVGGGGIPVSSLPHVSNHALYSVHRILLATHKINDYYSIPSEALPTDVWRKPLCMFHLDLFSKCRIPHPEVDQVRHTPISDSKHIIVIRNGHVSVLISVYE